MSEGFGRHSAYSLIPQTERHAVPVTGGGDTIATVAVLRSVWEIYPATYHLSWVTSPPQSAGDNEHEVVFGAGGPCRDKSICVCASGYLSS